MNKSLVGIVVGVLIAACAAQSTKTLKESPPPGGGGGLPGDRRAEIDALDQAITDEMAKLNEPRPAPEPGACVQNCRPQQMTTMGTTAVAPASPECRPATSATCTDVCTLKGSICENASKICKIAADLGGGDAYANDKCNKGSSSCDAAKRRCCGCS